MILTVTLNPALDLTYAVDELRPHTTHRVRTVHERAGGKGLNVASVLHALGEPVLATGLLGGATGTRVRELLAAAGVPHTFARIAAETRRTVTIADGVDATGLWEPGPSVETSEWLEFLQVYGTLLAGTAVVVLSGSLPQGLPADAYAVLIDRARSCNVRTVLDTSGEPLRLGLAAAPDVVKPNAAELADLLRTPTGAGTPTDASMHAGFGAPTDVNTRSNAHTPTEAGSHMDAASPPNASTRAETDRRGNASVRTDGRSSAGDGELAGAGSSTGGQTRADAGVRMDRDALRGLGAGCVVVSRGAEGLMAVRGDEGWRVAPPVAEAGNPTGAGDACVAALARGLRDRLPWPEVLADAVALSAAAVAAPVAGAVDEGRYRALRPGIAVYELSDEEYLPC